MIDIPAEFRSFLLSLAPVTALVGEQVCQDHVPQEDDSLPFIFFRRAGEDYERTLDESVGRLPDLVRFDLECTSDSIEEAQVLASTVKAQISGYRGVCGAIEVQAIFVDDHNDDYLPLSTSGDDGREVASLSIALYPV
jgi:hypothetical protein